MPPPSPSAPRPSFKWFGPGIITATVGGATHGLVLLWALLLGAFIKFVLSAVEIHGLFQR